MNINVMLIDEEYGYQRWINFLPDKELEEVKRRWKTMKGLNCLVGIKMIFPTARQSTMKEWEEWSEAELEDHRVVSAHVHESDDSRIEGFEWTIPEADRVEVGGGKYSHDDLFAMNQAESGEE